MDRTGIRLPSIIECIIIEHHIALHNKALELQKLANLQQKKIAIQYMEDSSTSQRKVIMDDGKFCKCDEGWTCNITQTEASKAGTPFSKCGSSCICITDGTTGNRFPDLQNALESSATGKVFCKCDEGWTCVISKADGPQAGKAFFECGEGCICVIDEANKLQVTCA